MRGGQGRQLGRPPRWKLVRHHRVFARMPGVFEPCTRLTIWGGYGTLPSNPAFVASDRSQVALATGPFDLGDWDH